MCQITHEKWEGIFDCPLPWEQIFKLVYKTTVDVQNQYFQIKMIYNFLPTRKMLKIWKLEETDDCRFGCQESESTLHLVWCCPTVALFWGEVEKMCLQNGLFLKLDPVSVMFGEFTQCNDLVNLIIILGKQLLNNFSLNIVFFKKCIQRYLVLERYMLETENDYKKHRKIWEILKGLF